MKITSVWAVALALLAGCAAPVPPEPVRLDLAGVAPSADTADLAAVLASAVTDDGRVDPDRLAEVSSRLDAQLRRFAVAGPTATPQLFATDAERWAYWHNARAAWSLKLAVLAECTRRECHGMPDRSFPLDGRTMSLSRIDQILLSAAQAGNDFRLAACAAGALIDYGPLPREPFLAGRLQEQLAGQFNRFVLDSRRFVIDIDAQQVLVPPMVWAVRAQIAQQYKDAYHTSCAPLLSALEDQVSRPAQHRLQDAIGYECVPQPPRMILAVPKPAIFFPGSVGRTEPD